MWSLCWLAAVALLVMRRSARAARVAARNAIASKSVDRGSYWPDTRWPFALRSTSTEHQSSYRSSIDYGDRNLSLRRSGSAGRTRFRVLRSASQPRIASSSLVVPAGCRSMLIVRFPTRIRPGAAKTLARTRLASRGRYSRGASSSARSASTLAHAMRRARWSSCIRPRASRACPSARCLRARLSWGRRDAVRGTRSARRLPRSTGAPTASRVTFDERHESVACFTLTVARDA